MRAVRKALTFDDVLLVPAHSLVVPNDVSLKTRLTASIALNIPLLSAAMDTVTETRLAIAIAQEGGLGVVHKNMPPAKQAAEVAKVKRFESGVVKDPITIPPTMSVREVLALTRRHRISGLAGRRRQARRRHRDQPRPPVRDEPRPAGVEHHDQGRQARHGARRHRPRARQGADAPAPARARAGRQRRDGAARAHHRQGHPQVDRASARVEGRARPAARRRRGRNGRRHRGARRGAGRAPASTSSSSTPRTGIRRACSTACSGSRSAFPQVQVIGGNIATADGAKALADHGADAVKVGVGPGSICTTRIVAGVGVPQISAIQFALEGAARAGIPVIADGGIRYSGDIAKALAAGASSVMLGSLFAGTEEAPGEIELYQGRSYKSYRGMGSLGAMQQGSSDRYFQDAEGEGAAERLVPQGIEGRVPYKGALVGGDPPADGRPARGDGLLRLRDDRRAAHARRVRRDHVGRHPRIARARRADRQGSPQLSRRVTRAGARPLRAAVSDFRHVIRWPLRRIPGS